MFFERKYRLGATGARKANERKSRRVGANFVVADQIERQRFVALELSRRVGRQII